MKPISFISQVRPCCFLLNVHAKPGARRSSLAAWPPRPGGALEVRIAARPAGGQANTELVDFMQTRIAQCLVDEKVKGSDEVRVSIVRGRASRNKVLEVCFPGTIEELMCVLHSCEA